MRLSSLWMVLLLLLLLLGAILPQHLLVRFNCPPQNGSTTLIWTPHWGVVDSNVPSLPEPPSVVTTTPMAPGPNAGLTEHLGEAAQYIARPFLVLGLTSLCKPYAPTLIGPIDQTGLPANDKCWNFRRDSTRGSKKRKHGGTQKLIPQKSWSSKNAE